MPRSVLFSTLFLAAATLAGCAEQAATTTAAPAVESETPAKVELTDADRKAIDVQKVCPVGGADLGSMGDPVKVAVKGRDVYLCCEHCREALLADPDKFLAKIDAAKAAPAAEAPASEKPAEAATPAPGT
jgi:hypothetical protein